MAFNDNTVDAVKDALAEIQELRVKIQAAKLSLADASSTAADLIDSERDSIRTRMNSRVQTLRAQIVAQVATW
jgi:hypothetical protein